MFDPKSLITREMTGLGRNRPLTVRETRWGCVVQSAGSGSPWRFLVHRATHLGLTMVLLVVAIIWLIPLSSDANTDFAAKAVGTAFLLGMACSGVIMARRIGGYAFHIDTSRGEVRCAVLTARGQAWIRASYRFDEIEDAVLECDRAHGKMQVLCLRLRDGGMLVPVAVGDEETLLGVFDRLMRDLRPAAAGDMAARPTHAGADQYGPKQRPFPKLGPEEAIAVGHTPSTP